MRPRSRSICWLIISAGLIFTGATLARAEPNGTPTTPQVPAPKARETPTPAPSAAPTPADTTADTTPYDSSDVSAGATTSFDSAVGYIDSAIPSNVFRLRFDAAWGNNNPSRAEFFYAKGTPPGGPGLPLPETNVDYQEISGYLEGIVAPNLSVFVEAPFRMLNPEVNSDHDGFGDMNAGFKWAFLSSEDLVTSFQLRVYAPTGDAHLGLGTRHVSLEPALLGFFRLSDKLRVESELRLWVPVGGTDFAGNIIRYGIGLSYGERPKDDWWITPVVETVGWTVLSGKEQGDFVPPTVDDATGDTIVNLKLGVRVGFGDRFDVYSGYGRALTGWVWYKDIWRTELRISF